MQMPVLPEQFTQRMQVLTDKERAAFGCKLKDELRSEISADVEAFLKSGGKITSVGASSVMNAGEAQAKVNKFYGEGVSNIPGAKVEFSIWRNKFIAKIYNQYLGAFSNELLANQAVVDGYKRMLDAAARAGRASKRSKTK